MNVDDLLKLLGALSPFLLLGGGFLVNRRINAANAAKTAAEARLAEATADKTDADVQSAIIANTKNLLTEARLVQAEKDAVKDERISVLVDRVGRMENRFESLRAVLATHGVWDAAALVDLRAHKPDYPEPPPFPPGIAGDHHHHYPAAVSSDDRS